MKGLLVQIYKSDEGDSSNRGLSSKSTQCILVGEDVPELFEPSDKIPAVTIVKRRLQGGIYLTAYPVDSNGIINDSGRMFGGCFIYTCDSRFRKVSEYPVPLHDRRE